MRRRRVTSADVPDLESVDEPLPYEELAAPDRRPAAEGARRRLPPLRLRPQLRRDRQRARLARGGGPPGRVLGRPPPAQKEELSMTVSPELDAPLPRRRGGRGAARRRLRAARLARRPAARGGHRPGPLRISYDADPEREVERARPLFGAARAALAAADRRGSPRSSTSTSPATRREFDLDVDLSARTRVRPRRARAARPGALRRADDLRDARRAGRDARAPRAPSGRS